MQIIQKKGNMKIYEKLNLYEYQIYGFCLYKWKWGTDFIFQKKTQSIVNILFFL